MDPQVRTSFIPRKPIDTTVKARSSAGAGIFFFLAFVIFLGSTLLAGGAFLYERQIHSSIASKSDQLAKARAEFEPATIQNLIRLDDRLNYSKTILNSHLAPSSLFQLLSQYTLSTVSFTRFAYEKVPDGHMQLSLDGITNTFNDVALQSDEFSKIRQLKDVIFSNFSVQDKGGVVFAIKANVDPEFLLYRTLLSSGGVVPTQDITNTGTTTTPTPSPTVPTP